MPRQITAEDYRVRAGFEALRQKLLDEQFANRLDRPLAYWALPADRRLPLILLGRTLRELLQLPYEEISDTPGVGLKKLGMLLTLLARATHDQPPQAEVAPSAAENDDATAPEFATHDQNELDPAFVSEQSWERWCETVRQHGLGQEKLGRLAPSLQELPTVIWNTPLSTYLDRRLTDIRQLKTHGKKRVRAILGVFQVVHTMLSSSGPHGTLSVRLLPRFVRPVEEWVTEVLGRPDAPTSQDVRQNLALPLLNQIEVDAGETILRLAENRLGIESPPQSVHVMSRGLGVTRARVYQLLEVCSKVMEVRWPEGRLALAQLADRLARSGATNDDLALFHRVRELFYPHSLEMHDGAAISAALVQPAAVLRSPGQPDLDNAGAAEFSPAEQTADSGAK